jgi:RHS repeat-associated protein
VLIFLVSEIIARDLFLRYNALNRLTVMQSTCVTGTGCGAPGTPLASYAYTLGPAGNRLSVAELSGRTVNYGYDDLYRLTSETIAGATSQNGAVSYQYDSVGNRLQRNSTVPALPATGLLNYDANDRTATDPYDADGNLLNGGVGSNTYDFENHLVAAGGVSMVYDGDGNRVKETVATTTTSYLIADQNLTGYAQVMDELQGGAVSRTYSYGLELINERQSIAGAPTTSFYGYDGHGSVRFLLSSTGAVTDTYDYDAFGNLIASTGSTPNNFRFAGEQFDTALGIYYNRARYYDQRQGRFWTMDTYNGNDRESASLHRYLYAGSSPVDRLDPSGNDFIDVAASLQCYAISVAQAFPSAVAGLGLTFSVFNIGLFVTNEQFRNDVIAAVGPGEAANLVRADIEMIFEFGGAGASAIIKAVRGSQTSITLDLFGGEVSQIPGAINVDLRAKEGLVADVQALPFSDESVGEIIASGPQAPFLDEAARVLKPGGRIYINYTRRNSFAQLPDDATLQQLRLKPIIVGGPLDPQFAGQAFTLTDGTPIRPDAMLTSILEKF